ncbi:WG repeat-containing protein [Stenotrophomonas sp. MMGLT7]|uniref:WG repeat-containing protein n=1 Tax=Stenotrophomonas sp. MMGLT7 TaxID=2901227 RepID=UPI001E5DB912|nr:WG repeat-containing protein [Stenotrophomonas sp. MMGLT7]MCD7099146.1 WG repeat-containing protein [Stenotrophomonas sp. MMGLT7]
MRSIAGILLVLALLAAPAAAVPLQSLWPELKLRLEPDGSRDELRIVDARGKVVLDHVQGVYASGGYAVLQTGKGWGVMRADGRMLVTPEHGRVEDHPQYRLFEVCKDRGQGCGLVDHDGRPVLPLQYEHIAGMLEKEGPWEVGRDGRSGVFDPAARRWLLEQAYSDVVIAAGLILARVGEEQPWQVFDRAGVALAVPPSRHWKIWVDGNRVVGDGMYDPSGRKLVPPDRYARIVPGGASARVYRDDAMVGLIDAQGRERVPPQYEFIREADGGYQGWLVFGVAGADGRGRRTGVMDASGKVLVPARWKYVEVDLVGSADKASSTPVFIVGDGDRVGVLDASGRELFAPRFGAAPRLVSGALYEIEENGRHGICDFVSGQCPLPPRFDSMRRIDDSSAGHELYVVARDGRFGLYSASGQEVVPLQFEAMDSATGSGYGDDLAVAATRRGERQSLRLRLQDGQWRAQADAGDGPGLGEPYDGHPLARLRQPAVVERYLPEGLTEDAAIRRAFADGVLREPVYPSLQLTGTYSAYVWLSQFAHSRLGLRANVLRLCREPDGGFRLLLGDGVNTDAKACVATSESLRFDRQPDGALLCRECAALQLPVRWVRRDAAQR